MKSDKVRGFLTPLVQRMLIFAVCCLTVCAVNGQGRYLKKPAPQPIPLDTAIMEIVYLHKAYDPRKKRAEYTEELLTIGPRYHHYGGYGNYRFDSLTRVNPYLDGLVSSFDDYMKLDREYGTGNTEMTRNLANGEINYYDYFFMNYYKYTEPQPEIDWTLEEGVMEIEGHECRKATASWRGRDWTAWYSELPFDAGPWKFSGLPGTILKVEDSEGHHVIEAIDFLHDPYVFGYKDHPFVKTTREKFNSELEYYRLNSGRIRTDSGMVTSTDEKENERRRKRTSFHAPIELE